MSARAGLSIEVSEGTDQPCAVVRTADDRKDRSHATGDQLAVFASAARLARRPRPIRYCSVLVARVFLA